MRILKFIKENFNEIIDNKDLTTGRRIQLLLISKFTVIYNILIIIYLNLKKLEIKQE